MWEEINRKVLNLIKIMMEDVDFGYQDEIGPDSCILNDLDFDSIKVIQLFTKIQKQFGNRKIPFQNLVFRGDAIVDFTIHDLVEFLYVHLNGDTPF